jgi:hypothetical protein
LASVGDLEHRVRHEVAALAIPRRDGSWPTAGGILVGLLARLSFASVHRREPVAA